MVEEREMPRKRLSTAALRMMRAYDWPGNVRQLQNILERAVVLSQDDVIGPEWIPRIDDTAMPLPAPAEALPSVAGAAEANTNTEGWLNYSENEKEHLRRTLEHTGYNQSAAARLLEIDYRLLLRRMKKHGLKPGRASAK
jgi:DNA-binding NtrC family response regulator